MVKMIPQNHTVASEIILMIAGSFTGDVTDTQVLNDGNLLEIQESGGTPGFDLHLRFDNIIRFSGLVFKALYKPGTHHIEVHLFNYETGVSDEWMTIQETEGMNYRFIDIPDSEKYIKNSSVVLGFDHVPGGIASHEFFIDYVALVR